MIPSSATPVSGVSQYSGNNLRSSLEQGARDSTQAVETNRGKPAPAETVFDKTTEESESQSAESNVAGLSEAVQELQQRSDLANKKLEFQLVDSSNTLQVLVIDGETDEVIREIPPDEVIRLSERIRENLGLVFDTLA